MLLQDADYDPHQYRVTPKGTNNFETLVHLIKCSLGTGILALPQSFERAGMITGVIGTVVVGVMLTHCLQILVKMQYKICQHQKIPFITYTKALESAMLLGPSWMHALAKTFAGSVDVFNVVYQLGICCVYIVFLSESLKKMIDPITPLPLIVHSLYLALPLMVLNLIPSLKALAPLSLLANLLTLAGIAIIYYYLFTSKKPGVSTTLDYWGTPTQVPLFFGTMLFALTSVPVVVALERNMATPKSYTKFFGVLNIGMCFIIVLYAFTGFFGYMYCVNLCSDSITLDLPSNGKAANAVQVLIVIAIFISYALHCYVPVEILYKDYILPRLDKNGATDRKKTVVQYIVRIGLTIFTLITAILVPRLGLFISLIGSLGLSALGMCFPTLMEICVSYPNGEYGPGKIYLLKDILLFLFGLMGLVVGTGTSVAALVLSFM